MSHQPESKLQRRIREAVEAQWPDSWMVKYHGGPFTRKGVPDLLGCVEGRHVALEAKRPGEVASPAQLRQIERLRAAGAIVGVVWSIDDALALVATGLGLDTCGLRAPNGQFIRCGLNPGHRSGCKDPSRLCTLRVIAPERVWRCVLDRDHSGECSR